MIKRGIKQYKFIIALCIIGIFVDILSICGFISTYSKKVVYVGGQKITQVENSENPLGLLPEDEMIFEAPIIIEKVTKNEDGSYYYSVEDVTMTEFDCYMERSIEKGFKDEYYYNGGYCFWHGRHDKSDYEIHLVYDKDIHTLYVTLFKESEGV